MLPFASSKHANSFECRNSGTFEINISRTHTLWQSGPSGILCTSDMGSVEAISASATTSHVPTQCNNLHLVPLLGMIETS